MLLCSNEVLHMSGGIDEVGGVQWDLLGYLILAWAVVYMVIWKGLHNSGKVWRKQQLWHLNIKREDGNHCF